MRFKASDFFINVHEFIRKARENQPGEGELAWLVATLEECLEVLGILLVKSGAKPSVAFSHWRLARGGLRDATGRGHYVYAECLEILNILE